MRIPDGGTPAIAPETQPLSSGSSASHGEPSTGSQTSPNSIVQHAFASPSSWGERTNLRGLAFTSESSASISRTSPDFEVSRTTTLSYADRYRELTATQTSVLKLSTLPTPSGKEATPKEGDSAEGSSDKTKQNPLLAKTDLQFLEVGGSTGASVASKTFSSRYASLTVSALGVAASGQANVGITHDGITAQASGNASAYLLDVKADAHAGPLDASGEATVGATANGNVQLDVNPLKGDVSAEAGGDAFVGVQANETAGLSADGSSATETANVGAGVGVDAKMDVGCDKGKLEASLDLGAYVGVGAGFDVSVSVNVPKVADGAWHAIASVF